VMALFLVRHAKAGSRSGWVGPDEARPLSKGGREQAENMTRTLAERPVRRILSSPYTRCVETVRPLATKLGLPVEEWEPLAEGGPSGPVVELLASLPDDSVDALQARGMALEGEPDYRKGATWVIERDGDEFMRATATPPPT
jgi:phosphohistidine phosphatase SixA